MKYFNNFSVKILLLLLVAGVMGWVSYNNFVSESINSFEECVDAGFPVMESYPEQCRTPGGKNFVRKISGSITVEGEAVCLPHKGDGPQTLECAFGIKDLNGRYYQIGMLDNPMEFSAGKNYRITGVFTEDSNSKYDILGLIRVESISQID